MAVAGTVVSEKNAKLIFLVKIYTYWKDWNLGGTGALISCMIRFL